MLKKLLAGVAVATVLAVGGIAVAGAVSSPSKITHPHAHGAAPNLVSLAVKTAADTIGIDVKTLRAGVKSGHTVAQIAQQHHVAPATVVHAIVTKVDAAIDTAQKAGKISAARAAKAKQRIPALADRIVNHTTDVMRGLKPNAARQRFHTRKTLNAAAAAIGITPDALRQALHAGQTIAAVARAHHVDPAKVAAAMTTVAEREYDVAAHRADRRYRARIPKIMQRLVNGTAGHATHSRAKAKAKHANA